MSSSFHNPHPNPEIVLANPGVQRVVAALAAAQIETGIIVHAEPTHSSQAAADVLGVDVAQIAKSVIFRAKTSDRAVLVITSGANRVNEKRVMAHIGETIGKADAAFVKERTGFTIGGVAPLGHLTPPGLMPPIVLFDETLLRFEHVFPAAGHPNTGFPVSPAALARAAGAIICSVV